MCVDWVPPPPGYADIMATSDQVHYKLVGAARSLFGEEDQDGQTDAVAVDGDGRPITVTFARSGITVPWRENTWGGCRCAVSRSVWDRVLPRRSRGGEVRERPLGGRERGE